jgi:hypothetical protein
MLLSNDHNAFPVVDSNGRKEGVFLGLVQRPQLEALLLTPELWQLPSLGHASPLSGARNGSFCAAAEAAAIDWSSDLGMSSSDDSFEAGEWFATCGERAAEAEEEEEEKEEEVAGEGDLRVLRLGAGQTEEGPETTEADRGIWAALISSIFEPSTFDQVTPHSPVISLQPPPPYPTTRTPTPTILGTAGGAPTGQPPARVVVVGRRRVRRGPDPLRRLVLLHRLPRVRPQKHVRVLLGGVGTLYAHSFHTCGLSVSQVRPLPDHGAPPFGRRRQPQPRSRHDHPG